MGMFTKLFQKSHDPYELGGKWCRIKSTPTSVLESDLVVEFTGSTSSVQYTLPAGYKIMRVDLLYEFAPVGSAAVNVSPSIRILPDGRQAFYSTTLPKLAEYFEIYLYVVKR